jgi:hypothetical protein
VIKEIDDALIKIIDGRPDGCREYRWPLLSSVGAVAKCRACFGRNDTGFLTTAESRERRGPVDGTGR